MHMLEKKKINQSAYIWNDVGLWNVKYLHRPYEKRDILLYFLIFLSSFAFQERANLWSAWQQRARSGNAAWCWATPLCQWSSGSLSSRCGPPSMTLRSADSPLTPRTSPSAARWPSAPTLCWVTPPSAPGRLSESWSGCGARSGDSLYWMRCTLYRVSFYRSFSWCNCVMIRIWWSSEVDTYFGFMHQHANILIICALCSQNVSPCSDHCPGTLQTGTHCHTGQRRWQDRGP